MNLKNQQKRSRYVVSCWTEILKAITLFVSFVDIKRRSNIQSDIACLMLLKRRKDKRHL